MNKEFSEARTLRSSVKLFKISQFLKYFHNFEYLGSPYKKYPYKLLYI